MEENGYSMEYGDAYMEQEEEWEREGLLDPAWEKQQKKVSVVCYNYYLCNGKDVYVCSKQWRFMKKNSYFFVFVYLIL